MNWSITVSALSPACSVWNNACTAATRDAVRARAFGAEASDGAEVAGGVDLEQRRGGGLRPFVVAVLTRPGLGLRHRVAGQQAGTKAMPNCNATFIRPSIVALQMNS